MPDHEAVVVRAYASPTLVLLGMDWPAGAKHADFLGFSIRRSPGYGKTGTPQFLFNKLDFVPLKKGDKPRTSDRAPIQKFQWWDGGIGPKDTGKHLRYTITPIRGTGAKDLHPVDAAAVTVEVVVPAPVVGGIGTWFNRAVVSSQSYSAIKNKPLATRMTWLANGIERAVPDFLGSTKRFDCGIYHLTDKWKITPAMKQFPGPFDVVYFFKKPSAKGKGGDKTNVPAVSLLQTSKKLFHERTHIRSLMHDKYVVAYSGTKPHAVLMGSMNFTPEAATVQANLLHAFASPELAALYAQRHALLAGDPPTAETAAHAKWQAVHDVPGTAIRAIFTPEPTGKRSSIDVVINAVQGAHSSVFFCMFSPTDEKLLKALLDAGDQGKIMYGLLNSIPDPAKAKKTGGKNTAKQQIMVEVFNRSRKDRKAVTYDYFRPGSAPRGFLPELSGIDTRSFSLQPPGNNVPAVHIHHKFLVIDGDTASPTIYTGSANMSSNSTNFNDENLLEIKGNTALGRLYVAEFLRLYNHYRARAVWEFTHGPKAKKKVKAGAADDPLVLKKTRDEWVNDAYRQGTAAFASRVRLAGGA